MMEKNRFIFPLAVALWLAAAFVSCREDDAPESQGLTGITTALVNTTPTEITVCGMLLPEAGGGIREWGVCWGAKPGVTTDSTKVTAPVEGNTFRVVLPNLEPMRVYYVRCYAVNDEGTVYGNELSVVAGDMELTPKEIPDTAFRRVLLEACDHNGDGRLMVSEAAVLASLELWNDDMVSLEGGRYLYRLERLELNADRVVELKDMPRLQNVSCSGDQASFKVENCPGLETLILQLNNSQAVSLEVEGSPKLKFLALAYMGLADLDLRNMPELRQLASISCPLTSLDLSPCPKLEGVNCRNNQLTVLDVSAPTELEDLDCDDNRLTALKLGSKPKLQHLSCRGNQLTKLDLSRCQELKNLYCGNNLLTTLDVSKCPLLEKLECKGNAPLVTVLISPEQAALQDTEGDIPGWSIPAGTAYVIAGR